MADPIPGGPSPVDLLIVSGSSRVRTAAPLNHRLYADRIGAPYVFDLAPSVLKRIYLHKLDVLRRVLPFAEWTFWIDDDAFFTNFDIDLRSFLQDAGDRDVVFCRSPVNPRGGWTWMSSGQFFVRRSPSTLALLDAVAATNLDEVRRWWRAEEYGLFTNGDQDAFVFQLMGPDDRWRHRFLQLPWQAFNSRPYHYERDLDEHFVCHFAVPGGRPKADLIAEFATRMGTTQALCEPDLVGPYRVFLERSEIGPFLGVQPPQPGGQDRSGKRPRARRPLTIAGRLRRLARPVVRIVRGLRRP
jgi:hypothetical protein